MRAQHHANWNEFSFTKADAVMKTAVDAACVQHCLRKGLIPWGHLSPGQGWAEPPIPVLTLAPWQSWQRCQEPAVT